jgi:hypothetical protein
MVYRREIELGFGSVDVGLAKSDGEADGGVEQLIVIGKIGDVATEIVDIELELVHKGLGRAHFVIVAMRRLNRQPQDVGIEPDHFW